MQAIRVDGPPNEFSDSALNGGNGHTEVGTGAATNGRNREEGRMSEQLNRFVYIKATYLPR